MCEVKSKIYLNNPSSYLRSPLHFFAECRTRCRFGDKWRKNDEDASQTRMQTTPNRKYNRKRVPNNRIIILKMINVNQVTTTLPSTTWMFTHRSRHDVGMLQPNAKEYADLYCSMVMTISLIFMVRNSSE